MTRSPRRRPGLAASSAAAGFVAGALAMALLVAVWSLRAPASSVTSDPAASAGAEPAIDIRPSKPLKPPGVSAPPLPEPGAAPTLNAEPLADLRQRKLTLPVQGALRAALHDSFDEARGTSRKHEAIDILAPHNTPALAVEDGTIAKLFVSAAGGNTVYLFDPSSTYVYYYAHLDHYAPGLAEGKRVTRGQVIGFVGTSGNAPKDTPHLHFAIFKLTPERKWWQGTPIDPYDVLK